VTRKDENTVQLAWDSYPSTVLFNILNPLNVRDTKIKETNISGSRLSGDED
jgi:hypothetical protein